MRLALYIFAGRLWVTVNSYNARPLRFKTNEPNTFSRFLCSGRDSESPRLTRVGSFLCARITVTKGHNERID